MKIVLTSENSVRLVPEPGPMTIEAQSTEQQYSPFHMLGSSLAFCTFSVMYSWATHVKLPVDDLTLDVAWDFAEDPRRVGEMRLTFDWPSLPTKRIEAAKRAAALCTVHATLSHPPHIVIASASEPDGAVANSEATTRAAAPAMAPQIETKGVRADTQPFRPMSAAHEHRRRDASPARDANAPRGQRVERERPIILADRPADAPPVPQQQGDGQEPEAARPDGIPTRPS